VNGEHSNSPASLATDRIASYTPGPWREHAPKIDGIVEQTYRCIVAGCGYFPDENEDEPNSSGFKITTYIKPADARLIAAAPDLLEALQKAADTFRDLGLMFTLLGKTQAVEACQIAEEYSRAAITKAEGRS